MAVKTYTWDFGDAIPLKSTIEAAVKNEGTWLPTLRILFVLSGSLNIRIGAKTYLLNADDLILINPYEVFSVQENGGTMLTYDLDMNGFDRLPADPAELWFECNSHTAANEEPFKTLKTLLARFIKFNVGGEQDMALLNISIAYAILHHLITYFTVKKEARHYESRDHMQRIEGIVRYIGENYKNRLMLKDVANHFFLSVPYMSKIFRQYFGCTFTDYLTEVQLSHATRALGGTQSSVDEIARQHGFASTRSFNACFRQAYGVTPSQYRKRLPRHPTPKPEAVSGNTDFVQHHDLELLARYLDIGIPHEQQLEQLPQVLVDVPPCDAGLTGERLRHSFRTLTSIGQANHILLAENQAILKQVQRDIGFKYIIFHGLLDDDMMVYGEDSQGNVDLNFGYVNMVIDFLRSIGLRPFIELSFMPRVLSAEAPRTKYFRESLISLPKSMEKWVQLVQGLVQNLNSRYGADEVANWPFSLWNLPDSSEGMFGLGGLQPYYEFYSQTWNAVKACNPDIRFGGPSCLTETAEKGSFMADFAHLCRQGGCPPDFYQYHFYPVRVETQKLGDLKLVEQHLVYRLSADALRQSITRVKENMAEWAGDTGTLYITEWNSSISHRELLIDTAFQAAYIVKNVLENYDAVDGLCYWVLSDSIDEVRMTNELYHGGLGLFTYNGIRKASYYAFKLLARLGDTKLASGEGWFITRSRAGLQILLYNYHHFSTLYANGELFDMTFTNRYTPFPNSVRKKIVLPLTGMSARHYILTETTLNPKHGSSFDKWVELGALPLDTPDDIDYLKNLSVPQIKKRKLTVSHGELTVISTLEPHEVKLIEIRTG